ncbi:hypothetical protein KIL84_004500 [Mauremys mutica]|uniref:Uncharacterized protein n=1 Tax=Mauremys mutica TaxID=74926 RepID=A0A9D3XPI1_9SAUR|nr:hypothetical protein KIL84_004500 [Mauremys mutica]
MVPLCSHSFHRCPVPCSSAELPAGTLLLRPSPGSAYSWSWHHWASWAVSRAQGAPTGLSDIPGTLEQQGWVRPGVMRGDGTASCRGNSPASRQGGVPGPAASTSWGLGMRGL